MSLKRKIFPHLEQNYIREECHHDFLKLGPEFGHAQWEQSIPETSRWGGVTLCIGQECSRYRSCFPLISQDCGICLTLCSLRARKGQEEEIPPQNTPREPVPGNKSQETSVWPRELNLGWEPKAIPPCWACSIASGICLEMFSPGIWQIQSFDFVLCCRSQELFMAIKRPWVTLALGLPWPSLELALHRACCGSELTAWAECCWSCPTLLSYPCGCFHCFWVAS